MPSRVRTRPAPSPRRRWPRSDPSLPACRQSSPNAARVTPSTGPVCTSQVRKVRILSTNRLTAASVGKSGLAPGLSSEEWKYMVSTRPPRRRWR